MEKKTRDDRQLKLWGERAHRRIEEADVCVVGSSVVGTEILKCLVLPGIKSFTMIDDVFVSESDLQNNYFAGGSSDIGKSRAQITSERLGLLNPNVKSNFIHGDLSSLIGDKVFWNKKS